MDVLNNAASRMNLAIVKRDIEFFTFGDGHCSCEGAADESARVVGIGVNGRQELAHCALLDMFESVRRNCMSRVVCERVGVGLLNEGVDGAKFVNRTGANDVLNRSQQMCDISSCGKAKGLGL